jgi:putative transposase
MQEALITKAFKRALTGRKIQKGTIIHSDRGGQYAGKVFRKMITDNHPLQNMSHADNPYDNVFMESYFSRSKADLLQDGIFETIEDAQTEIFEYIEMYYYTRRIHSSLNYQSPDAYEKNYYYCLTQENFVSV